MTQNAQSTGQQAVCPRCLELLIKIRQGEITGAVLSCHPLDEMADIVIKEFITSKKLDNGRS